MAWQARPEVWELLNTNGASKGNPGMAAGGGVLLGDRGEWVRGFSENFGVSTLIKVSLKVASRGLRMCRTLGFRKVWLQLDSLLIVGMIRGWWLMEPGAQTPHHTLQNFD